MAGRKGVKGHSTGDGRKKSGREDGPVIQDPRFARLHSDPRFQRMPKNKAKVVIDARFQHMFTDKSFSDPHALDKRGRKTKKKDRESLRRYYKVTDGEEQLADVNENSTASLPPDDIHHLTPSTANAAYKRRKEIPTESKAKVSESPRRIVVRGAQDLNSAKNKVRGPKAKAKDEAVLEDSGKESLSLPDEEVSDDSFDDEQDNDSGLASESSSSDDDSELEEELQDEEEEKVPITNEETRRLAIVNMDWQHIKAVDLFVLLKSFLPKGGEINSVSVYPSEFGLEQMKQEESQGPKGVFEKNDDDEDDDDGVDMEKLRQYEKAKLRYYYAVVDCDSTATASSLYAACDGMEFERTSNALDLRFIPDQMEFKHPLRDTASEIPIDYKAPEFETRALQHSKVKLTWDDDEPVRVKALRRNFTAEQLNELDFKEYLASESDEDAEEEQEYLDKNDRHGSLAKDSLREKYRSLLLGDTTNKAEEEHEDMEITFHTGLDELSQRLLEKKEKQGKGEETVWEAYLRRKKEKKKQRAKDRSQTNDSDADNDEDIADAHGTKGDSFFEHDADPFADPFFASGDDKVRQEGELQDAPSRQRRKNSKGRLPEVRKPDKTSEKLEDKESARREDEKSKAELELLLMDDHGLPDGVKGYNVRKQQLKEKRRKKRKGGQQEATEEGKEQKISVDLDDPRFASLFTSHQFAIEPTDPNYKRSATQLGIVAEKQRQRLHGPTSYEHLAHNEVSDDHENSRKRKAELSSIVRSLKKKVGRFAA